MHSTNRLLLAAALFGVAFPLRAQNRRVQSVDPDYWLAIGAAAYSAQYVDDGETGSRWDFGNSTSVQYRVSLEKALQGQNAIGLLATYGRAAIAYSGGALSSQSCINCSAHVDLYTFMATFHAGGGVGFHQVVEVSAGIHTYDNFRRDEDQARLAPTAPNNDFAFTAGYGFGYGLSPRMTIMLVQDFGLAIHESTGLSGGQNNTLRFQTTRLGLRLGVGNLPPIR